MLTGLRLHRNYRLYFVGQLISMTGTWLQNAAQAWLILDLTHSAAAVGVLGFCLYSPYAVLGLIGGAYADRWPRHRTMIVTQSGLALAAVALTLMVFLHRESAWAIDAIALVRGVIQAFNNPSRQALMVQLVGRAELSNAIALNSSLNNATRVVGPALAGVLITTVGVGVCFLLNAISFVAVIVALVLMRPDDFFDLGTSPRRSLRESIGEGLAFARHTKTVLIVLAMLFVTSTMAINFNIVLPVFARVTMHGTAQTYGFITSAFGLGAVAGAAISAGRKRASPSLLRWACCGFGVAQVIVATQRSLIVVSVALVLTGVTYTLYTTSSNALVQLATPGYMQGRVGGLYNYVFIGSGPLGSLIAGWICERGAEWAFAIGGVFAIAMAIAGWLAQPWPMPTGTVGARRRRRAPLVAP